MNFRRESPNAHYRILCTLSEMGRWQMGLTDYPAGARLRMGLAGRPPSLFDFCIGRETSLHPLVFAGLVRLLEPLPECATPDEIDRALPWAGVRPDLAIHLDGLLSALSPPRTVGRAEAPAIPAAQP